MSGKKEARVRMEQPTTNRASIKLVYLATGGPGMILCESTAVSFLIAAGDKVKMLRIDQTHA